MDEADIPKEKLSKGQLKKLKEKQKAEAAKKAADDAAAAGGGGSTSAPSLQEIKATFEQRRTDSAHQMKQLLASIDPSLALFN